MALRQPSEDSTNSKTIASFSGRGRRCEVLFLTTGRYADNRGPYFLTVLFVNQLFYIMHNFYRISLSVICLLFLVPMSAQRIVSIDASGDPNMPTDISPIILGDTTATGDRVDNNTVYTLENGQTYVVSRQLDNKPEWPLQIEAADLDDTENKPRILRLPNASGDFPNVFWPEGDMTLRNLWVVAGEKGAGAQHDWGKIRILGENARIIVDHCIIEKDRGGFLQVRANGLRMYVSNSTFRNGGNRRIFQGNGRGIDGRNFAFDSLVVTQSVFHNIQDRVFRSQGASMPHNYIEFDRNTVFNQVGRHGCFQFGQAMTVKVTNNLLQNPIMLGTTPAFTDEQTQPDNESHKVFTVDTLFAGTTFEFAANNIYYTQDVLDYFASNDTVSQPAVYSELIANTLGADAPNTFYSEVVTLEAVPDRILPYVVDVYEDISATDMYDFIVEDVSLANTPLDFGNIFDFSTFSPCYSPDAMSATAATDGGAVGASDFCANLSTSVYAGVLTQATNLSLMPNPVGAQATIQYELSAAGPVRVAVFSMAGRQVAVLDQTVRPAGVQTLEWNTNGLPQGLYLVRLQTAEGEQSLKAIVR